MGGDIKGGGMTIYEAIPEQNPALIYGEGLRVPRAASMELENLTTVASFGKKKGFDRVINYLK